MMYQHQPVLCKEVIEHLNIKANGFYIDGTFGRGGHSQAILEQLGPHGSLLAIDKDPTAIAAAQEKFAQDQRFSIVHASFAEVNEWAKEKADGILLDLGVSSPQLDDPDRGFSFMHDGPLDMRMNSQQKETVATWLSEATAKDIRYVLVHYGEERFAKRIAEAIVATREETPLERTLQLADLIQRTVPTKEHHKHPATRTFQALRIFINNELEELELALKNSIQCLKPGGRLVVISFHSLEDRIVKRFMRNQAKSEELPKDIPVTITESQPRFKVIGKMIQAGTEEITNNPRARSARLRIGEVLK